jgi:predicted MFS family arabinose efflux permease
MLLAAWLSATLVIPPAEDEPRGAGPLLGMYNFLSQPVLLRATIVTILLYVGNTITANMNLYSKYVMGGEPEAYAGYQNALRFAFKGAFGFLIGSWLTRASPRAGIVVTGLVFVAAQLWALFATGNSYLLAFGIYGAGELVGVYAPNYILSASRRRDLRRNMAFVTMMMVPAAPAGALFGAIVDLAGPWLGAANAFRLSFVVCCAFLVAGLALALVVLPARPSPNEN